MKQYIVDFYDAFDGWSGDCVHYVGKDFAPERLEYDDIEEAIKKAKELQKNLDEGNKRMGEHWGVIDLHRGREVFCQQI